ncbi:sigma factor [Chromobacterium phragmitis]|uniref:Sigma factor n=1 Tax=Chromobacterium phragmitis TaxID=2202141 RepID=A0ABV0J0G4_9NEIS
MAQLIEQYEALIHKLARRANTRLRAAGCDGACLEDLLQEARLCFVRAERGFDPEAGAKFITYLYLAIERGLNRYIDGLIEAGLAEVSTDSLAQDDDGERYDFFDRYVSEETLSPEEIIERKQCFQHNLKRVAKDSVALAIVRNVISPTQALEQAFHEHVQDRVEKITAGEFHGRPPKTCGLNFIARFCSGGDWKSRNRATKLIKQVYADYLPA